MVLYDIAYAYNEKNGLKLHFFLHFFFLSSHFLPRD